MYCLAAMGVNQIIMNDTNDPTLAWTLYRLAFRDYFLIRVIGINGSLPLFCWFYKETHWGTVCLSQVNYVSQISHAHHVRSPQVMPWKDPSAINEVAYHKMHMTTLYWWSSVSGSHWLWWVWGFTKVDLNAVVKGNSGAIWACCPWTKRAFVLSAGQL